MMVVFFALLYALGSMVLGGMLILARVPGGYTSEVLWGNVLGQGPWNYPGLLIVAPWGVLSLPFLGTVSMILVSAGVGIGISVALLIAAQLVRDRKRSAARPGAVASVAGLTPAMIALVTLGACCSTTAAATAGVGLVAQASGSTLNNLLLNNWYLDVFQVVVVFVALLAQEMLLRVYGGLFGMERGVSHERTLPVGGRAWIGGAFRAALLLAGVTWSLAMFAEWTTVSPFSATPTLWFQWIFQHQFIAGLAIVVALFPAAVVRGLASGSRGPLPYALRLGFLVGGLSLASWVPGPLASGGAAGLLNELFWWGGLPGSWGAVAPVYSPGVALFARWGLQYLLLGGFATAVAFSPRRALAPAMWTWGPADPSRTPAAKEDAPNRPAVDVSSATLGSAPDRPREARTDPPMAARGAQDP